MPVSCLEATVRFAAELGYEVTAVKDATASYSLELIAISLLKGVVYGLLPTALLNSTAANSQRKACIAVTPSL